MSHENTITIGPDTPVGRAFNLPTVVGGEKISPEEAIRLFRAGLLRPTGMASTLPQAVGMAEERSLEAEAEEPQNRLPPFEAPAQDLLLRNPPVTATMRTPVSALFPEKGLLREKVEREFRPGPLGETKLQAGRPVSSIEDIGLSRESVFEKPREAFPKRPLLGTMSDLLMLEEPLLNVSAPTGTIGAVIIPPTTAIGKRAYAGLKSISPRLLALLEKLPRPIQLIPTPEEYLRTADVAQARTNVFPFAAPTAQIELAVDKMFTHLDSPPAGTFDLLGDVAKRLFRRGSSDIPGKKDFFPSLGIGRTFDIVAAHEGFHVADVTLGATAEAVKYRELVEGVNLAQVLDLPTQRPFGKRAAMIFGAEDAQSQRISREALAQVFEHSLVLKSRPRSSDPTLRDREKYVITIGDALLTDLEGRLADKTLARRGGKAVSGIGIRPRQSGESSIFRPEPLQRELGARAGVTAEGQIVTGKPLSPADMDSRNMSEAFKLLQKEGLLPTIKGPTRPGRASVEGPENVSFIPSMVTEQMYVALHNAQGAHRQLVNSGVPIEKADQTISERFLRELRTIITEWNARFEK